MAKKRYALYISRPLANKFELIARRRHGSKSALLEEALRVSLEPQQVPGVEEVLVRRLDELHKIVGTVNRDVAIATETLALFVRYFLTITPPLPLSEQEPARLLGRERFQVFVAQVGRRLATDHRLVSEVLETIASNNPDLFATATDDTPLRARTAGNGSGVKADVRANTTTAVKEDNGHG
jgi:hypothetical protein